MTVATYLSLSHLCAASLILCHVPPPRLLQLCGGVVGSQEFGPPAAIEDIPPCRHLHHACSRALRLRRFLEDEGLGVVGLEEGQAADLGDWVVLGPFQRLQGTAVGRQRALQTLLQRTQTIQPQ